MKQKILFLTDIQLHTREKRPTLNYESALAQGRLYNSLSPATHNESDMKVDPETGEFRLAIPIPEDLQAKLDSGEVVLALPKGGLKIMASNDYLQTLQSLRDKRMRMGQHNARLQKKKKRR